MSNIELFTTSIYSPEKNLICNFHLGKDLEKTNSMNFVGLNFFSRQIGPFFRQFGILECENKK